MSPIPPQATRFNILKAPATGAQGTHILSESAVPLRKNTPHTQIPGSRCGDSPATHTHPGPSFLLRASRLHSHSSPPSPQPGGRRLRRGGGGARTCPRRPRPDNARESGARARRSHLAPANTYPLSGSPAEAQTPPGAARGHGGGEEAGRAPQSRPTTRPQRPRSPRKHTARRSPPGPFGPDVSTRDGAGRAPRRRRRRARFRGRSSRGCGRGDRARKVVGGAGAGAGPGLRLCQTLTVTCTALLPGENGRLFW